MRGDSGGIRPDRNPEFSISLWQTHKHAYAQRKKERGSDSVTLPTADDAKMIIMPGSLP